MSTNISKLHREDLLDKIRQIRTYIASAPQDANTGNLLQYLDELTKDVKGKKYGLVFEQHREQIDDILDANLPVLTEQKDLFIGNGGQMNFLIEGDNLAALQLLEKTHKGRIDVIYIDPPYNRGTKTNKDFYYDDYIDDTDTYKHSKWISFIIKRIEIVKKLLSKDGIMFVSIDEHEVENLKMVCNECFGEHNVDFLIWRKNGKQGNTKKILRFKNTHEYIVVCFKNKASKRIGKCKLLPNWKGTKTNVDNDPRGKWESGVICRDEEHSDISSDNYYTITSPSGNTLTREFYVSKIEFEKLISDNRIYFPKGGDGIPRLKIFENEEQFYYFDSIIDEMGTFTDAKEELASLFGDRDAFDTPKPTKMIKEIIRVSNKSKSSIVLDFFAGSGTTGHAVMKLNAEDGGKRRFILCTNNENNICRDVTYERLRTVITGRRKDGSEYSEKYKASLKYYKIEFVPISEQVYYEYADELLLHIRELVELENGINFNGNGNIAIVLTDEEMEKFVTDKSTAKMLYRGHNVLFTAEQEAYVKTHDIQVNVIPNYYYNELNK